MTLNFSSSLTVPGGIVINNSILIDPTTQPSAIFPTRHEITTHLVIPFKLDTSELVSTLTPEDPLTAFRVLWFWVREGFRQGMCEEIPSEDATYILIDLKKRILAGGYYPLKDNFANSAVGRVPPYKDQNGEDGEVTRAMRECQFKLDWVFTERAIEVLRLRMGKEMLAEKEREVARIVVALNEMLLGWGVEPEQLAAVRQRLANITPEELAAIDQRLAAGEMMEL